MKFLHLTVSFVLYCNIVSVLYAEPIENKSHEEILNDTRLSRIPQIIELIEQKGRQALEQGTFVEAKSLFQKSYLLRQAIGMRETEGGAKVLHQISYIEQKMGNQCEASKLSRLAKRIYRQIGVNIGAVEFESQPSKIAQSTCADRISWASE